jgi:hypothetical protein
MKWQIAESARAMQRRNLQMVVSGNIPLLSAFLL